MANFRKDESKRPVGRPKKQEDNPFKKFFKPDNSEDEPKASNKRPRIKKEGLPFEKKALKSKDNFSFRKHDNPFEKNKYQADGKKTFSKSNKLENPFEKKKKNEEDNKPVRDVKPFRTDGKNFPTSNQKKSFEKNSIKEDFQNSERRPNLRRSREDSFFQKPGDEREKKPYNKTQRRDVDFEPNSDVFTNEKRKYIKRDKKEENPFKKEEDGFSSERKASKNSKNEGGHQTLDQNAEKKPKSKQLFDDDYFLRLAESSDDEGKADKNEIKRPAFYEDRRPSKNLKFGDGIKKTSLSREKKLFQSERKASGKKSPIAESDIIRLNKFVSQSGLCSRRKAAEMVKAGEIKVNGIVELNPAYETKASDIITHNSKVLKKEEKHLYVLMNKPKNVITTADDEKGRKTVMDLLSNRYTERIYPVGRLDRQTTGLLLLTNDGELAKKLSHPSHQVKKIYQVELDLNVKTTDMEKIRVGLMLEDGVAEVDSIEYIEGGKKNQVGIEIHSGKNRIVRRIFESLGYEVVKLDRTYFAGLTKKDLPRGFSRELTEQEIIMLKHFTNRRKSE